jgi:23S rRNA (adenine2030-N6)-methyltransferase
VNYRHAFHAGNFADVLKHAVLARIIAYQQGKPGPIAVIETHAGAGLYDLAGEAALRTGEAADGVDRLDATRLDGPAEAVLAPWRHAVGRVRERHGPRAYPGSPLVAAALLRPRDRYVGIEWQADAHLVRVTAPFPDLAVERADGYARLPRLLPPPERRGFVLLDPPFEARDEFDRLADSMRQGLARWPTGTFIAWYPVKNPKDAERFVTSVTARGEADWLRMELYIRPLDTPVGLAGCGLLVLNPPWVLQAEADMLLPQLATCLASGDRAGYRCEGVVR